MTQLVIIVAMSSHNTHPVLQILGRWPTRKALAEDVGKPVIVVHRWHQRKSIPAKYDFALIEAAKQRKFYLDLNELASARRANTDQDGHVGA